MQYKKTTATSFGSDNVTQNGTAATITGLDKDTSYQVRVRAKDEANASDIGPWSLSSVGSTNKEDNNLPTFTENDGVTRTVLENAEPGLVVGFPVSATDTDNVLPLTYRLHGPDADSFDLHSTSGQIRPKRGVVYDAETKATLSVTATVSDGQGGSGARAVTINVTNVPEAPSGSSRSLDVSWTAPENMGPPIAGYDVRYREGNSGTSELLTTKAREPPPLLRLKMIPPLRRTTNGSNPAPPTKCTCGPRTVKSTASGQRQARGGRALATASLYSMTGPA